MLLNRRQRSERLLVSAAVVLCCASCAPRHKPVAAKLPYPEIQQGMERLREPVHGCYERHKVEGHAQVTLRIEPDGRVSKATVGGKFAGTPSGECVRRLVLGARFTPFKGEPVVIQYPLLLR